MARSILFGGLILFVTLTSAGEAAAQSEAPFGVLKIFSSDTNAAPYIMTDGVTFVGGVVKEMNDEAARRSNVKISYSLLSRKSVDASLLAGDGHMTCNIQPAWTKIADQLIWTEPMFSDSDVFWRAGSPDIQRFEDLKGRSFATFKGYHHHQNLTRQVAAGETKRIDLYPSENIFDVLASGRAEYVVFSKIRGDHLLKTSKHRGAVAMTGLIDSTYPNFCAMSRKAPIDHDAYIRALNGIARDGTLDQILARYR